MTKQENIQRLDDIANLKGNWNGYGAKAFPADLISKCKNIAAGLDLEMDVYQTGRQSIQFQYDENGNYLEFEVFQDHTIAMYVPKRDYSKAETCRITNDNLEILNDIIHKYFHDNRDERE